MLKDVVESNPDQPQQVKMFQTYSSNIRESPAKALKRTFNRDIFEQSGDMNEVGFVKNSNEVGIVRIGLLEGML